MEANFRDNKGLVMEAGSSRLRLQTSVRLRWFAVAGQLLTVTVVHFGLGFSLPIALCVAVIALSAWVNVFLTISYSPRHHLSSTFAACLLAYDLLQLAALLYLTGGIENPFAVLLVAPVTVSAATLPARHTMCLGALAFAATMFLVFHHYPLPWLATETVRIPLLYKIGQLTAVTASLLFLGLYAWRLAKEARQMSAALSATELVLAREQQLHALDGLAAAAAHELGTPLATIALVTRELERELKPDSPYREDIELLHSQALRCREILQKLTSRPSEQDPLYATISLEHLIEEAVAAYRVSTIAIAVELIGPPADDPSNPQPKPPVGERRPGVIYGLGNLIENAVDFARSKVEIGASWDEDYISIVIADDGPGFPPGLMDLIGDPYVTTRSASNPAVASRRRVGLGLGFFIARTLLERSGASISLANRQAPSTGALVTITWPRAAFEGQPAVWPPRNLTQMSEPPSLQPVK